MENELLGIGRLAKLSGLPVSALRFYDGAGVLLPSTVDPSTGYRFYESTQVAQARLVTHLRRVGLPLDAIRAVLAEPSEAAPILAAHLSRLEAGLADARREISIVHQLLENTEIIMHRCTLPAAELIRALRDVRYAVCDDPDQPRLNGVFIDSEPGLLRVVATDRYRLTARTMTLSEHTELHLLLPTAAVDELLTGDHRPARRRCRRQHDHPVRTERHRPGAGARRRLPAPPQLVGSRLPASAGGRGHVAGSTLHR